jgi:demethylmenaquinone methyltransferase/2-methoxy-6-polyprenyl-1,4-benzoquinol methylase
MKDPYQKFVRRYDTLVEPFITALRRMGLKMVPPKDGMLVLDIGCGTGTSLRLYHDAGCRAFGIDLSPSMLAVARNKLGARADLRLGDATHMPYPDGIFDLVVAMFVLHDMPGETRPLVMGETLRILKHDGGILLIDYHSGRLSFPAGWFYKTVILFFEIAAGRQHFKNYRDFMEKKGLSELIVSQKLTIEKKKRVIGGNIGMYLLRKT